MKRRDHLKMLAAAPLAAAAQTAPKGAAEKPAIQLHVDLEVDPAREREMVANFRTTFRPAIRKQPGFVDVRLLKLRSALAGKAPAGSTYRLLISFETEEQRQKWVATDTHQKVWPTIEGTLKGSKYTAILYDTVS